MQARKSVMVSILIVAVIGWTTLYVKEYKHAPFIINIKNIADKKNIVPVAIIGSGPAGLTAAIYTARARCKTVLFTGNQLGGQISEAAYVENWPGMPKLPGVDVATKVREQAEHFGAEIISQAVTDINVSQWPFVLTLDDDSIINALSVIIATGGEQRVLKVPGVTEYWGKGIGVCTICDAPFDKGKDVAVVGGGDTAADKALQSAVFANKVTILVKNDTLHAASVVQEYIKAAKNISILYNTNLEKIEGDGERVSSVTIKDSKTGNKINLAVQSIYFALGFDPNTQLFVHKLNLTHARYIKLYQGHQTSQRGVFAAGNVEDAVYQKASVAAGSGVRAAIDAIEFLQAIGFTPSVGQAIEEQLYQSKKPLQAEVLHVEAITTEKSLKRNISQSKNLVFLEVFSAACPLCKQIKPWLEELAAQWQEQAAFFAVDQEKVPQVIAEYAVQRIPIVLAIKEGNVIDQSHDIVSQKALIDFVQKVIVNTKTKA